MDNRWIFLYCDISELWGHRGDVRAGNEKAGASGIDDWQANPPVKSKP